MTKEKKDKKNIRIYKLARKLDISSKELLKELDEYGLDDVTSHMSTIDHETAKLVIEEYESRKAEEMQELQEKKIQKQKEKKKSKEKDELEEKDEAVVEEVSKKEEVPEEKIDEEEKLRVREGISVRQLAKKLQIQGTEIIAVLMKKGIMATINQRLGYKSLSVIADDFDFIPEKEPTLEEKLLVDEEDDEHKLVPRAPVVTVMGHVDHGKTSLLDAIRDTNVMDSEFGGITQHIGAYKAKIKDTSIVFIDTPGHEAFTAMRAHGAKVTDIVVLVVAADDGVMPQTVEAIDHARAAGVPIVVAINKIDKNDARVNRTKQQLSEHGLMPEEWGGNHIFAEVSAKNKTGIKYLLEMLLLETELLELTANPQKNARGTIVEAEVDDRRGPVATVLVQSGTLRIGAPFIAGLYDGKVRAMINDRGKYVKKAGPSTPVEVLGFSDVPEAGDQFYALDEKKDARDISESRKDEYRRDALSPSARVSLANLYEQVKGGEIKELNIVLKGDVQGSIKAISGALQELSTDEVKLNVIHQAVGRITETDIMLASASNAIVIGFNTVSSTESLEAAKQENVDVRIYNVIYELLSDVQAAMEGMLEPESNEVILGKAAVREVFNISRIGTAAGCYVTNGRIVRNENLRVIRGNKLVFEGKVDSLKRFKDDVREVSSGYECGISMSNFDDFELEDILECYTIEKTARKLEW